MFDSGYENCPEFDNVCGAGTAKELGIFSDVIQLICIRVCNIL